MIRRKPVASLVAAAIYAAGTAHAATNLAPDGERHQLMAPNLTQQQINRMQLSGSSTPVTSQTMLANDGVNVQINRQDQKFAFEEGVTGTHVYFVRLNNKPVTLYKGEIEGLASTHVSGLQASSGAKKLFVAGKEQTDAINKYQQFLTNKQASVAAKMTAMIGDREIRKQYTLATNGFTVEMTQDEAKRVSELAEVAFIHRAKTYEIQTDAGPERISADHVWTGETTGTALKGEGVIVGIIDTGINSDHPSFADVGGDGYDHTNPWGQGVYVGACADEEYASLCNDKLIGIRSYDQITDVYDEIIPGFPAIGEDYTGHGSHVASTAAGNQLYDVDFVIAEAANSSDGALIKEDFFPMISGVAPHANIISYQVCYADNDEGYWGCPFETLIEGIEDAIRDGVDVINFSIGGVEFNSAWNDGIELAFLAAREAGVSVAASAGNSGTLCGAECFNSSDHSSPWLLNVAATTHDREVKVETPVSFVGFANDENGEPLGSEVPAWSTTGAAGGAINNEELTGVVVWARDYANSVGRYDQYCGDSYDSGTFDFYKDGSPIVGAASGDTNVIVVCARNNLNDPNGIARTDKVANVKAGGADGYIMYNYGYDDGVPLSGYELPGVHFTYAQWWGDASNNYYGVGSWVDSYYEKGHILTIGTTLIERDINEDYADWLADFSSRGPSNASQELLVPQISAPGVDIYAAYADEHPFTSAPASSDFATLSGTSMASPHTAGALALIRQAHPDWTATEVQSALALTADNVVKYRLLNQANGEVGHASTYRAGAGRINVANAIDTGLVMDETPENFMAANPTNGGQIHRLNIPQLVNMNCKPTCKWLRTFKATKDGTWSVSHSDVFNWNYDLRSQYAQNGVNITATPSEFSLKAGETQAIVIEASIMDTQDLFSNAEVELHSDLILTEVNGASPEAHIPVVFKYDMNNMPARLRAVAHRNEGSAQFNGLYLPELDQAYTRVFAPVKAVVETVDLPKDDDAYMPWASNSSDEIDPELRVDEATHVTMVEVPANAKRLMVESLGTVASELEQNLDRGNALVYVGKDYNGNGQADTLDEILCVSNHVALNNFCNINNPEPGTYWVVIYNVGMFYGGSTPIYPELGPETFSYAITIVNDQVSSEMSLEVEESNGIDPVSATLNWNMPDMQKGDIYYSVLDFGTSEVNAGNIGRVAFKLERGQDDVHLDVTQDTALPGDVIPYTFEVQPNDSGVDRHFTITTTMPEGLSFNAESILASNDMVEDIVIEGNVITISGFQPDTSTTIPHYIVTTNETDEACRTPDFGGPESGGYVDLESFGFPAMFGGFNIGVDENGNTVGDNYINFDQGIQIPVDVFFNGYYDSFHLYNNDEQVNVQRQNILSLRANGNIGVSEGRMRNLWHQAFPYNSYPFETIGPMWRSYSPQNRSLLSVPLINSWNETAGITLANTTTGWGIIEYDNARSYEFAGIDRTQPNRPYLWNEFDDRFDFELIFNVNTRFGKNQHEIYMAYDNIDFGSQDGRGSIGLQGFKGPQYAYGPVSGGFLGSQFALDDLDQKLHDGLVVCYDYYGPESSQFEVTIWTQVKRNTAGTVQSFTATSVVDGLADYTMVHDLTVPSNLTMSAINDMSVDENEDISFTVTYVDNSELTSANMISVTGDHISVEIDGHESGDSVTITPDANFHGEVEVTVMVSDIENPHDSASSTFTLTVNSDGVELGCTDSAATNYDQNANEDNGSCIYPEAEPKKKSSSGSMGIYVMLLMLAAGLRRKQR